MTMSKFHFVRDYRKHVSSLMAQHPLDEAMSLAVGGNYDSFGEIEKQILIGYGLQRDHILVDIGCGSGRLVKALVPYLTKGQIFATDVVQELLDYARIGCPSQWQFRLVEDIHIPLEEDYADFVCFFSVFTHLLHEESYCYLLEAQRVLKPGGWIVFSFLEFAHCWPIFEITYKNFRAGQQGAPLNMFIGRDAIEAWAKHSGLSVVEMHGASDPFVVLTRPIVLDDGNLVEGRTPLGQSVCVMRKT